MARWVGVLVQVGRKSLGREASRKRRWGPRWDPKSPRVCALLLGLSRVGQTPAATTPEGRVLRLHGSDLARPRAGRNTTVQEAGGDTAPSPSPVRCLLDTSEVGAAAPSLLRLPQAPGGDLGWGHPGFLDN